MKSYTDINQSKKLTEILPIESADMHYSTYSNARNGEFKLSPNQGDTIGDLQFRILWSNHIIPCWSLAALLSFIKDKCSYFELVYLNSTIDGRANILKNVYRLSTDMYDVYEKEAIDACYEMIIKLYKQKLLKYETDR